MKLVFSHRGYPPEFLKISITDGAWVTSRPAAIYSGRSTGWERAG
ncbi:hypothetical protein ppKF707_4306 [Metapseudomonas furukawaii]|uniref:Uncharacterized protein n=1 Tax=Metapseudomonas furukawaii TaxID=1149133 RepID=A0AAD1C2Q0_METFU|nr:hypothetical protein ppKF707_4306 [Pseudomonas furukawaii]BAU75003.1 hypothetical protein KF707C_33150 [Pseudomonas furukawaii]